jgi:hypothetical protein
MDPEACVDLYIPTLQGSGLHLGSCLDNKSLCYPTGASAAPRRTYVDYRSCDAPVIVKTTEACADLYVPTLHRDLSYTWTCLKNRNLCWSGSVYTTRCT